MGFKNLTSDIVFDKLIGFGMFPESLDPIFNSSGFRYLVLSDSVNKAFKITKDMVFFPVNYKLTRNNNAPRYLQIPNPLVYLNLCSLIKENWENISSLILNDYDSYEDTSMITLKDNDEERLIFLRNYNIEVETDEFRLLINRGNSNSNNIILDKQFLKKYIVVSDIANFFSSIYTHSIPWAIVGKDIAKNNSNNKKLWYNKLDKAIRMIKNNETNGISIGPDTSNLISEIILSRIDNILIKKGYNFIRYIDDYKCYCDNKQKAETFIQDLSHELEKYNLTINTKKTFIKLLPQELNDLVYSKLNNYNIPEKVDYENIDSLLNYLDYAVDLSNKSDEYSPFKFAIKSLNKINSIDDESYIKILKYILNITFIHPYLIDSLDSFIEKGYSSIAYAHKITEQVEKFLNGIIKEHLKFHRSDTLTWSIYLAIKYSIKINNFTNIRDNLIKENDTIPILLALNYSYINNISLFSFNKYIGKIDERENWILIYEYYRLTKKYANGYNSYSPIEYLDFYNYLLNNNISFFNLIILDRLNGKKFQTDISF
nr:RNA-directed DNA polymerase [Candidatus Gracilibacteria bacterium]